MKILVVTTHFPLPVVGAGERDRIEGIKQFKRLGFDVRVLAKCFPHQDREIIRKFAEENNIKVDLTDYEFLREKTFSRKFILWFKRVLNPAYWDGAAYEYREPQVRVLAESIADSWRPDVVWFDCSFLWPLYSIFQKRRVPIITRPINFEARHYFREGGVVNYFRGVIKFFSEFLMVRKSSFVFAITPFEKKIYEKIGAKGKADFLPLRGLWSMIGKNTNTTEKKTLSALFGGASYADTHNAAALRLVLQEVVPLVNRLAPGKFIFYVTGKKLPAEFRSKFNGNVVYCGYVNDYEDFIAKMDVAISPSLLGAGMQQKIFEPICRGIPTAASSGGIAGYPLRDGEHVLLADSAQGFADNLIKLLDINLRRRISESAVNICGKLFSRQALDDKLLAAVRSLTRQQSDPAHVLTSTEKIINITRN